MCYSVFLFTSIEFIFFVIKNTYAVILLGGYFMYKNEIYFQDYESVSDDVKYITNSIIRLKVLAILYEGPKSISDLSDDYGLIYSSISSNMHDLELGGYVYRQSNKYHLSNSMMMLIENIMEFALLIDVLNKFFNILDNHIVDVIPNESVAELYLLGKARLLQSDTIDAYKTLKFMERSIKRAKSIKCILPIYSEKICNAMNQLVDKNIPVEAIVGEDTLSSYEENTKIRRLSTFHGDYNFLLVVTDDEMFLGLFLEDGLFDQNRLLTSKNRDSLRWANNLFENFKKKR